MCNFLSGIILKNGDVITNPLVDSHEDIIEDAGLSEQDNHIQYFARFEFSPHEREYHNLDKYMLRIDEESSPDWLTDEFKEKIERHCRLILSNIVITGECKKKLIAGRTLILSNFDGKNTNFKNCQIIYIDNSTTGYRVQTCNVRPCRLSSRRRQLSAPVWKPRPPRIPATSLSAKPTAKSPASNQTRLKFWKTAAR